MLHMFHFRIGDFKSALYYGKRCRALAGAIGDPAAITLAHSFLGISLLVMGDLEGARVELEACCRFGPGSQRTRPTYLGLRPDYRAGMALARTLWLLGYPVQAEERAVQTIKDAERMDHPVSLSGPWSGLRQYSFGRAISRAPKSIIDRVSSRCRILFPGALCRARTGPQSGAGYSPGRCQKRRGEPAGMLWKIHAARYDAADHGVQHPARPRTCEHSVGSPKPSTWSTRLSDGSKQTVKPRTCQSCYG